MSGAYSIASVGTHAIIRCPVRFRPVLEEHSPDIGYDLIGCQMRSHSLPEANSSGAGYGLVRCWVCTHRCLLRCRQWRVLRRLVPSALPKHADIKCGIVQKRLVSGERTPHSWCAIVRCRVRAWCVIAQCRVYSRLVSYAHSPSPECDPAPCRVRIHSVLVAVSEDGRNVEDEANLCWKVGKDLGLVASMADKEVVSKIRTLEGMEEGAVQKE
ncbi:hypothetical protein Dimus_002749 [Dionaea muscipula]